MTDPSGFQIRFEALKFAITNETDPDQLVLDAEKFRLFLCGEEQESKDEDTDRG